MKNLAVPIAWQVLFPFFLLLISQSAVTQPPTILFDHYTTADGLSNNRVWEICKSRKGYLWIGTQDGLNRFDGKNFKVFRYSANDSQSLSHNAVYELMEDHDGYLWIGTFSGLNRYNPANNQIKRIDHSASLRDKNVGIGAIAQAKKDPVVWVGTAGLFYVNLKTFTLESAPGALNKELFYEGGNISSLLIESNERIWIGSNRGLILYNSRNGSYKVFNTDQKSLARGKDDYIITRILFGEDGKLWAGTWGLGLLEFDTTQKKFVNQYLTEKSDGFKGGTNIIYGIARTDFPGEKDLLWLACNEPSYASFNTKTKEIISYTTKRPDDRKGIYEHGFSLFFHGNDGLWIGGEKGLYRYDRRLQVFRDHALNYNFENACLNYVTSVYPDPADATGNTLWVTTWSCGLFKYNMETGQLQELPGWLKKKLKPNIYYNGVLRDKKGIIWIGTNQDGVLAVDETKKEVTRLYPSAKKEGPVRSVVHLLEDDDGRIWMGTPAGLFWLDTARLLFHEITWNVTDSLREKLSKSINGLCIDKNGHCWFTGQNDFNERWPVTGRIKRGENTAEVFYHQPGAGSSLPDIKVIGNIVCDDNNRIWSASWNGLVNWDAGAVKPVFSMYTMEEGLLNDFINKVEVDENNNIWCATIGGLSVLAATNRNFINFNNAGLEQDNVADIFFNPRQNSLVIGDWGKLHTVITSESMKGTTRPVVTISDFRVFNKPSPEVEKNIYDGSLVSLAHDRNVVTIDFTALAFYNPSQVKYACKMEGVDKDWIITSSNSITYNLGSGSYLFRVKAQNAEGLWSKEDTSMEIIVRSPFWKKNWFIALVATAVLLLMYGFYRYRINQLRKWQAMRNNISQNLHDDIGASLSNINILNELARRNLHIPGKSVDYLHKAGEDIQRISESLSDIVWNINPRYDDLQNLFVRMKRYASDMLDGKNISYEMVFPEEADKITLSMEKRRDFYLIFKEAINNLVKYSGATSARVVVETERKKLIMSITDNGVGFDSNRPQYGNGISNMKQRAGAWKDQLQIKSEPGKGTAVRLEMSTT